MVLRRVGLCFLLWALVLAPTLGLVHRVVHGGGVPPHVYASAKAPVADESLLDHLMHGHSAGDCRLYDQHTHGDAASSTAMLALPVAHPAVPVCHQAEQAMLRWITLFDARGPPLHT